MTVFDNDVSYFYCVGCKAENFYEEGAMCEACGAMTCAGHIDLIDRTHTRPKYWTCYECKGDNLIDIINARGHTLKRD